MVQQHESKPQSMPIEELSHERLIGDDGELRPEGVQAMAKKEQRGLVTFADPIFDSVLGRKIGLLPMTLLLMLAIYFIGLLMAGSLGLLSAYLTSGAILLGVMGIGGGSAAMYHAVKRVRQALDDLGAVIVSPDYEYQSFVMSWTRMLSSSNMNLISFLGTVALLLITGMLLAAVFLSGMGPFNGPFRPTMFSPDYLNRPVSLVITVYFAVLCALVVGNGIKLLFAGFRLIAFCRNLQPIAEVMRLRQGLRGLSNLSVLSSGIWLCCSALIGTLLFNALSPISSLMLLAFASPGLYLFVGAQSTFRHLQMKANAELTPTPKWFTLDLPKVAVILVLLLLVLFSPVYGQPLGALTGLFAPHTAVAYIERGNDYLTSGKYDLAAADYESALQLDPHSARTYYNRGNLRRIQNQYDLALSDFAQAITLDPTYAWPYYGRGRVRYMQQDYDGALTDFDQALKLYPNWTDAYFQRGWANLGKTDFAPAEADFTKAIQLGASDLYLAYGGRANARYSQGKYAAGIADSTQALQLNSNYANGYYYRALSEHALKNDSAAISDLKQILQLNPGDNWSQQIQDKITEWSKDTSP